MTIVEFSDFHCPFCKRVVPTLAQLESKYGDKIKLVFRDFPIEGLHPGATKAHEAARCAGSGKFQAAIKEDMAAGNRAGVGGTPAFFINGRLISGAQPLEAFARVIDDELARSTRSAQK